MNQVLCVLPHRDDAEVRAPSLVCEWHRRALTRLTEQIREGWFDLALITVAGSAPKDAAPKTRRTKSASPPAPANLDVIVLRDPRTATAELRQLLRDGHPADLSRPASNVLAAVASWVLLVAEERPLSAKLPSSVIAQLDLLERHGDWISEQPWIDDYWAELGEIRNALKSALHDRASTKVGRCYLPTDDGKDCHGNLLRRNGELSVRCHRCDARWVTAAELARLELALNRQRVAT